MIRSYKKMKITYDEYNQIMDSNEFIDWEDSIKRLIDYVVNEMDGKIPEDQKDVISEDIIINLFLCSLNLQDGIKND
jgi:hypothetical protein